MKGSDAAWFPNSEDPTRRTAARGPERCGQASTNSRDWRREDRQAQEVGAERERRKTPNLAAGRPGPPRQPRPLDPQSTAPTRVRTSKGRAGSTGRRAASRGFAGGTRAAGMVSAACVSTACVRGRAGARSSEAGTTMMRERREKRFFASRRSAFVVGPSFFFCNRPDTDGRTGGAPLASTKGPSPGTSRPLCTTKESIFEDGERPFRTLRLSPNRPRSDERVGGSRDPQHRASPGAAGRKMSH